MSLLELERISVGQVGLKPGSVKMLTTDNLATITTAGYLNGIGNQIVPSVQLAPSDLIECLYNYVPVTDVGTLAFLSVSISHGVITLSVAANPLSEPLTNGHIFVGNASNIATDVAMTGDVTISNTGVTAIGAGVIVNADINAAAAIAFSKLAVLASGNILVGSAGGVATSVVMSGDATIIASGALTIASNAITTTKILNANVTLAKLAAGITPSHVIKFANQVTTVGGAAAEAFVVTGALAATDRAFVQIVDNGTGNVTALQAVVTNDTLTVTFSGDPGNDTIINYQIIRVAS
jgi:hypothetical protein